jgi:hypothetical protein
MKDGFYNVHFVVLYDILTAINSLQNRVPVLPKVVERRKFLHEIIICFQRLGSLYSSKCNCPMYENSFEHLSDDDNPDEIF